MLRRALLSRALCAACARPALRARHAAQLAYAVPPAPELTADDGPLPSSSAAVLPVAEVLHDLAEVQAAAPRRRGRPKKTDVEPEDADESATGLEGTELSQPAEPTPRARPNKVDADADLMPPLHDVDAEVSIAPAKPKRGRKAAVGEDAEAELSGVVEKPKRTRKKKADAADGDEAGPPKKPRASKTKKPEKEIKLLPPIEESALFQEGVRQSVPEASADAAIDELREAAPNAQRVGLERYRERFHAAAERLLARFSPVQLKRYLNGNGIDPSYWSRAPKPRLAVLVLEKVWHWASLEALEKELRENTELVSREFPVTRAEARLLMGKDAADLRQLSSDFGVQLRLASSGQQLRFVGHGVKRALDNMEAHIKQLQKDVVVEDFTVLGNFDVPAHLIQRLSQLSNTFMEPVPDAPHTVRIHAKSPRPIEAAKRLAVHAASLPSHLAQTPLLSYLPTKDMPSTPIPLSILPPSYSLYPFIAAAALPWTVGTGGAFRIRRVGEWLGHEAGEDVRRTGGLARASESLRTPTDETRDVRAVLLDGFDENSGVPLRVSASTGHLLFMSQTQTQRATLVPPLTGSRSFARMMKWMVEKHARPHFVHGHPAPVTDALRAPDGRVHRLTYRSTPTGTAAADAARPHKVITLEASVRDVDPVEGQTQLADDAAADSAQDAAVEPATTHATISGHCFVGLERELDVLMPDRPMDMRFVVSQLKRFEADDMPSEFAAYLESFRQYWLAAEPEAPEHEQPLPPLRVVHGGEEYFLMSSVRGTTSSHTVAVSPNVPEFDYIDSATEPASAQQVPVVTETLTDMENELKTSSCQVLCDDHSSEDGWKTFLGHCDQLSSAVFQSNSSHGAMSSLFRDEHEEKSL